MTYKRILKLAQGILMAFIIFLSLFAFDVWVEPWPLHEKLMGFLIHMLPSIILFVVLLFSKRYTKLVGILFLLIGLAFMIFFDAYEEWMAFVAIVMPPLVVGVLFLVAGRFKEESF